MEILSNGYQKVENDRIETNDGEFFISVVLVLPITGAYPGIFWGRGVFLELVNFDK